MIKAFKIIGILFLIATFGCSSSLKSEAAFFKWLNHPKNGFVKNKLVNGFNMNMKFLPENYLAYNEFKNDKKYLVNDFDSNRKKFDKTRTFLFTIELTNSKEDLSNYNIGSISEYKERINQLNFNIGDYIFLQAEDGTKVSPLLATFENSYELGGKKMFYVVFSKENESQKKNKTLDIVFEDSFFDTGSNHFVFDLKKINYLPELQFIK